MKKGYVSLGKYDFVLDKINEATGKKAKVVWLRKSATEALVKARNNFGENYNFMIGEGKREIAEQRAIVSKTAKSLKKSNPNNWEKLLIKYTGGYETFKQKKFEPDTHLGGGAVDLMLLKNGKIIDMGGVKLHESSNLNYYEKKNKLTIKEKKIRDNRKMLKKFMMKAGFKPYLPEWWHWGYPR